MKVRKQREVWCGSAHQRTSRDGC